MSVAAPLVVIASAGGILAVVLMHMERYAGAYAVSAAAIVLMAAVIAIPAVRGTKVVETPIRTYVVPRGEFRAERNHKGKIERISFTEDGREYEITGNIEDAREAGAEVYFVTVKQVASYFGSRRLYLYSRQDTAIEVTGARRGR